MKTLYDKLLLGTAESLLPQSAFTPPSFEEFMERTFEHRLEPWQRDHFVPLLQRLTTERGLRILVHAQPQVGKSIVCSKRFPAYFLGCRPQARIVSAGYNVTHSTEMFGEPVRDLMQSDVYKEMFPSPDCRIPKVCSAASFSTAARSSLRDGQHSFTAVGLLSGFTGKGLGPGDVLMVDDPYASPDDALSAAVNGRVRRWWSNLASPRVHPDANVVIVFHRYHTADLAGFLMSKDGYIPIEEWLRA